MNYTDIQFDVCNGRGCGYSLYVQGCRNHCKGCFNEHTWDFNKGKPFTRDVWLDVMAKVDRPYIKRLTIIGGEPFEPENQEALVKFLSEFRARFPDKIVWCYTGFTYEEITDNKERCCTELSAELLSLIDILVDGRYVEELRDVTLPFRGSSNQRIIDLRGDYYEEG